MTNSTIDDFVQHVGEMPSHGLVIIAGPVGSGKTTTMQRIEKACVRDGKRGRYFRIGKEEPARGSGLMFVRNILPDNLSPEDTEKWKKSVRTSAARFDPHGVFIDDFDKQEVDMAEAVVNMALTGSLVVISIEANTAEEALAYLYDANHIHPNPNSLVAFTSPQILVQHVHEGQNGPEFSAEIVNVDVDFHKKISYTE